jgi:hypothetical protein
MIECGIKVKKTDSDYKHPRILAESCYKAPYAAENLAEDDHLFCSKPVAEHTCRYTEDSLAKGRDRCDEP